LILTLIVPVSLNIPVSVGIAGVVFLGAGDLNLLKTPLWQVGIASAEIAAKDSMPQAEGGGQSSDSATVTGSYIANDLDLPVVLSITDGNVAVAGDFSVGLSDGRGYLVRMKVASSLSVEKTNDIAVTNESEVGLGVIGHIVAVGVEEPVVVRVLVVVAGNLLLTRAVGIGLDMGVEKTATIAHVLDRGPRAIGNLKRTVLSNVGTLKVGLEERAHLGVSGAAMVENRKVEVERNEVDDQRHNNQANDTRNKVGSEGSLEKHNASDLSNPKKDIIFEPARERGILTMGIRVSPNLFQRSSAVYRPTSAVTKRPTSLTLHTQPMLRPVMKSQKNHSSEKLLLR